MKRELTRGQVGTKLRGGENRRRMWERDSRLEKEKKYALLPVFYLSSGGGRVVNSIVKREIIISRDNTYLYPYLNTKNF